MARHVVYSFKKMGLIINLVLLGSPILAQNGPEWGFFTGLSLTKPVSSTSYSVVGVTDEYDEGQLNPFYGAYFKSIIKNNWFAEGQLMVSGYSYKTKVFYEDTHYMKSAQETNEYKFVEVFLNNHYRVISGKRHELSVMAGIGLGVLTKSISMHRQELRNQGVIHTTFDFKGEEDDLHFIYQAGFQYKYKFESFSLLLWPFYKRFTEEQYVIPPKQLSAFGLGIGVQF